MCNINFIGSLLEINSDFIETYRESPILILGWTKMIGRIHNWLPRDRGMISNNKCSKLKSYYIVYTYYHTYGNIVEK